MAKEPSQQALQDYFNYIFNRAEEAKRHAVQEWNDNFKLYNDTYAFPQKIDWQTQVRDPIVDNLVVRLSNFLTRILITTDNEYYTVAHKNKSYANGMEDIIGATFRLNKFPLVFNDAFKMSLLTSPYVTKITYKYFPERYPVRDETTGEFSFREETVGRTIIEPIDPYNIYLDPDGEGYIIEEKRVSFSEFLNMARVNGWKNVDAIENRVITKQTRSKQHEPDEIKDNFNPTVLLHYVYSKAVTDKHGEILDEHVHFIMAEKEVPVLYRDNVLPKGAFPYVVGFPMKVLSGRYGRGYITKLKSVIVSYLESLNLIMDSFMLATMGAYEVVTENIPDGKADLFSSIAPGRMYPVTEANTISRVFNNAIDPTAVNLIFLLDRTIQNRSFQNEFFQGQPTAKGRPTASEIAIKTQETTGFITDVANEVERSMIEPTLWLTLATEMLYIDDPKHTRIENNVQASDSLRIISGLSFGERIDALKNVEIDVKGISGKVLKMSNFQKIIQILNVVGNIPSVANAINPKALIEDIFDSLEKAPEDIFDLERLQAFRQAEAAGQAETTPGGRQSTPQDIVSGIQQGGTNAGTRTG